MLILSASRPAVLTIKFMIEKRHIQLLPDDVANMIAAGEVVDRPCSVLKELVENSVDADATQIDVEVVAGGRKLIAVSDNGVGMNRDDALLSIERHATSKIRGAEDIERICTMGFRGEALSAISAVSRFTLRTCIADGMVGAELVVTGGKVLAVKDTGGPPGTRTEVRDLFFNVPARRKFLRSEDTELFHVRQFFVIQAMARPEIGMSLTIDGKEMYRLPGRASLEDRIRELFGAEYRKNLRQVDLRKGGIRVSGYVGMPSFNRSDRNEQFFFVNSRCTGALTLNYAVNEAYRSLLPARRHPSVFLFLSLDPAQVDVNVHPTKREVRFRFPSDVRDAVTEAVRKALSAAGADARPELSAPFAAAPRDWSGVAGKDRPADGEGASLVRPAAEVSLAIEHLPPTRAFQYPRMPMIHAPEQPAPRAEGTKPAAAAGDDAARQEETPMAGSPWTWCRVLGQIGGLYVLLETEDGFVIMDPHAAHERVLFEGFMADVVGRRVESQGLLVAESVEMMPADAQRVRKNVDLFRQMGFGIAEFGGDTFVVDALPSYFAGTPSSVLLADIAHSLEMAVARRGDAAWKEEAIAQAACKAAVKSRDKMTLQEIEQLVIDLSGTEMPYTCPHGRPTLIYTSFSELNRKFGRGSRETLANRTVPPFAPDGRSKEGEPTG